MPIKNYITKIIFIFLIANFLILQFTINSLPNFINLKTQKLKMIENKIIINTNKKNILNKKLSIFITHNKNISDIQYYFIIAGTQFMSYFFLFMIISQVITHKIYYKTLPYFNNIHFFFVIIIQSILPMIIMAILFYDFYYYKKIQNSNDTNEKNQYILDEKNINQINKHKTYMLLKVLFVYTTYFYTMISIILTFIQLKKNNFDLHTIFRNDLQGNNNKIIIILFFFHYIFQGFLLGFSALYIIKSIKEWEITFKFK